MFSSGFLLCFYPTKSSAAEAFQQLHRWRYRRTALIHKSDETTVKVNNINLMLFAAIGLLLGIALSLLVILWALNKDLSPLMISFLVFLALALAAAVTAFTSPLFLRLPLIGIDQGMLWKCARCLVAGETALVVQASPALMGGVISMLRKISKDQPTIFAVHPPRETVLVETRQREVEPLSPLKISDHARDLAQSHEKIMGAGKKTVLLEYLQNCEKILEEVRQVLAEASHLEQAISTSAEWILDNAFIAQNHISDVRKNLPKRFYRELPVLTGGPYRGQPRVYALASDLVFHTEGQLDRYILNDFLEVYQKISHLTTGELWAFPLMLRISLVDHLCRLAEKVDRLLRESESADFWANRLIVVTRNEPDLLFSVLSEFTKDVPDPSVNFALQLVEHLYDEEAALNPVLGWLERKLEQNLESIFLDERATQSSEEAAIGNIFTSLRWLKQMDWGELFEGQSLIERSLRTDPAGIYPHMDFHTRDAYRHAVESVSKAGNVTEETVARTAISMAAQHSPNDPEGRRRSHVGYYLIDNGRRELAVRLKMIDDRRHRLTKWIYEHHSLIYLGSVALATFIFVLPFWLSFRAGSSIGMILLLTLLATIPASQVAIQLVNFAVTNLLPPSKLPKMNFKKSGIPQDNLTLVVVPTMLTGISQIRSDIENLEIRYQANTDPNLYFALFTDYTDAPQTVMKDDERFLREAVKGIERLNDRYKTDRFYLLHRDREWSDSENCYMGWERKRGKLEDLHRFLNGVPSRGGQEIVKTGDPESLLRIRYVITLDSDTQLPRDTARRMVETVAHPLNQPVIDPETGLVKKGYTIIQPRISTSLPSSTATHFSRLFTDPVGTDPYTTAVSDVYQDLTGEGSFIGKGIYDPRTFHSVLTGRFPERSILSHDLIEGSYVRAGLASDIELLDDHPPDYISYSIREHRWIRGDWQIADRLLPWVVDGQGNRLLNPLSIFNRWKILDNLRRSLVSPASLLLLICAWRQAGNTPVVSSLLVGIWLLCTPIVSLFSWSLAPVRLAASMPMQVLRDLKRSTITCSLMIHQAYLATDAIVRVWYRRLLSHRGMLQWTTAQAALSRSPTDRARKLALLMMPVSALITLLALFILRIDGPVRFAALPYLVLWFMGPLTIWKMGQRRPPRVPDVSVEDKAFLRQVARRTWRTFDDLVDHRTKWLPADNYQVSHTDELARRTSPTNIGLYLLSVLAAGDFGYIPPGDIIRRIGNALKTMESMQHYEGHLLNWYDLESLKPLNPMYVSTVDSGNLIGCLWTLKQGLEEMFNNPLLGPHVSQGMLDTALVLRENMVEAGLGKRSFKGIDGLILDTQQIGNDGKADNLQWLRGTAAQARSIQEELVKEFPDSGLRKTNGEAEENGDVPGEVLYWAEQLYRQARIWGEVADRYYSWIPESLKILDNPDGRTPNFPTLRQLAAGDHPLINAVEQNLSNMESEKGDDNGGNTVLSSLKASIWLASDILEEIEDAIQMIREATSRVNMRFLYNARKRLFRIGFNVSDQRHDNSYYDLLASEARLASYIAAATGQVPVEHWMALGRSFGSVGRRRVLLSWGGTMFEYLMPQLFLKDHSNSLLSSANLEAIDLQIDFGRSRGVPWGISESAYADLDASRVYQYRGFGVPGLGLKRGLEDDLVVSPYASILALQYRPQEVVKNLHQLRKMGLLTGHGFYESIDFTRQRVEGKAGVIVRAYMAHHQGMAFLALDNFLNGNLMQKRFNKDVRVRAVEPLLFEKIPIHPPVYRVPTEERAPSSATPVEIAPSESKFNTPHTETPRTQILSNGRYSVLITNSGGGYSRWGDLELTRWRADATRDNWGVFCYIQDVKSGRLWSNSYQPVCGKMDNYVVSFALDRAEIRRSDDGVETETEIIVSPEDDAEIRRITLINRSELIRELKLTSYIEPVLAEHRADLVHPAFNRMFIRTEVDEEGPALLATRRKKSSDEQEVWIGHQMTPEFETSDPVQWETDRGQFLGRGRDCSDPRAMSEDLSGTTGMVLDPILSMRQSMNLWPGQSATIYLTLCAAESRDQTARILEKYRKVENIRRAVDLTWRQAQLELRHLRIQPEEARRIQQLASYMIYPSDKLRPSEERLKQNVHGQSRLWAHGISGDLPIMVVTIGDNRDIGLVSQVLQAHTYWRRHGLKTDLLILNEEASSYEQPLHNLLHRLVKNFVPHSGMDTPGGIYLHMVDQIAEEDQTLLLASARVVLVAARGHLSQQIGGATLKRRLPRKIVGTEQEVRDFASVLPAIDLRWDNGTGGFSKDGSEYIINSKEGVATPAPWINILANAGFGALVSESGSGFTWCGNSQKNRLTSWFNDQVCDPSCEAIYIRDEITGRFWTPTLLPSGGKGPRRTRHGQGYSVFTYYGNGLDQELSVFVPVSEGVMDPVKVQLLKIRNTSDRIQYLSITYYAEWVLGEDRETSQMHIVTSWDKQSRAMTAVNPYNEDYGDRVAFAFIGPTPDNCTGDREEFLGRNGRPAAPAAMGHLSLSGRTGAGMDPCAAIQLVLELEPGASEDIVCLLGQAGSVDGVRELVKFYGNAEGARDCLKRTKAWWSDRLSTVLVTTPEPEVNVLLNRWLPYQTLSCRLWARSGFYQSGGAFGFRDQLQDVLSLLHIDPSLARDHILAAAGRQFREGDVQHWWHQPSGSGIRSKCSDDLLWLPYAVSRYVDFTGDVDLLHEHVPFLEGEPLEDSDEVLMIPSISLEMGTIYEHCLRAVRRGITEGPHGLPLIGIGDWNDGMSKVGVEGAGESVWLAWFLKKVLDGMAGLAHLLDKGDEAAWFREASERIVSKVEEHAWDGQWYHRAYFDDGRPIGSLSQDEARIDSIAQSWAVISGGADPERARQAVESAWEHLVKEEDGMVYLLTPPFDRIEADPGYIKGYPPGVRENGGQYSHAAMWLAKALAMLGEGERASRLLVMTNPVNHTRDPEGVQRYATEPYVLAADVYALKDRVGRGGWTWYTGAAGWMYRVWLEDILGLKVSGNKLALEPVIPTAWEGFNVRYTLGGNLYDIKVENPQRVTSGIKWVVMNGKRLPGHEIPLTSREEEEGIRHEVIVRMGTARKHGGDLDTASQPES